MFLRPRARARFAVAAALCLASLGANPRRAAATPGLPFAYVSPVPQSTGVLPETNVIVHPGGFVDVASMREEAESGKDPTIAVSGSLSGPHPGRLTLSDDRRTLVFQPDVPFLPLEEVRVKVGGGLRTQTEGELPPAEFAFTVAGPERAALRNFHAPIGDEDVAPPGDAFPTPSTAAQRTTAGGGPLPPDFPVVESSVVGKTTPGRLFLANINLFDANASSYILILNDDGTPYFYRRQPSRTLDFKMQIDGRLSYFDRSRDANMVLDSTYAVVDSFRCGNGYTTDGHDFVLLPNGHALLMSYDPQVVDMSQIVPKGNPEAIVIGLVIQELDRSKDVVFQWRSWDHFQITDILGQPLGGRSVDYVHGNSLDADPDGNLLLSSRHLNEVTKIDRETGEVLWRLGGKNNQFTFVNDPIGFSYQHSARWLPNGHLVLFDNGVFHAPRFSRAVEYEIDERKKTATLTWQYRHDPDVFGIATGSVQRLPSGNTLIEWGTTKPTVTEVTSDGRVVSELSFEQGVFSYRGYRFEWPRVKEARVTLTPRSVTSVRDRGWLNATIEPIGFDASAIDVATVTLGDAVPAVLEGAGFGDANSNGISDLTVTFRQDAVASLVDPTTTWLTVEGSLVGGGRFRGYAAVRPLTAQDGKADGDGRQDAAVPEFRLVSAPGTLPILVQASGAGTKGGGVSSAQIVSVHDVRGRLVRRWSVVPDALRRVSWDGRQGDGRPVAAGLYFLSLEGRGAAADRVRRRGIKVVVAR